MSLKLSRNPEQKKSLGLLTRHEMNGRNDRLTFLGKHNSRFYKDLQDIKESLIECMFLWEDSLMKSERLEPFRSAYHNRVNMVLKFYVRKEYIFPFPRNMGKGALGSGTQQFWEVKIEFTYFQLKNLQKWCCFCYLHIIKYFNVS